MGGRQIAVGGHRGWIEEIGAGPPAVILASMFVRVGTYRRTAAALRRRFRVILVEMPGSGRGSRLSAPWDFERYARWAADLLPALGLEGATVIGHSNSGAVALWMGALHPERIGRLVLVDPVGVDPSRSALRVALDHALDFPLEPWFMLKATPDLVYNLLFHAPSLLSQVHLAAREHVGQMAPRVGVPTLIGWGMRDHAMPATQAALLHRLIPGSSLYLSRTGSHDWLIEEPDDFLEVLARFTAREPG